MKFMCAAVVAALIAASSASAATIVRNGSFEDGELVFNDRGWGVYNHVDGGWTMVNGAGIEIQTGKTLLAFDAQDGGRNVELDSDDNSSMMQRVNLSRSGRYILTFFYASRQNDSSSDGISYSIGDLSSTITSPSDPGDDGWTKVVSLFSADAGDHDLYFGAMGKSDSRGGLIDNVSIDLAPVPIPAAGFLLLGALGGLAAIRRSKSAAAV